MGLAGTVLTVLLIESITVTSIGQLENHICGAPLCGYFPSRPDLPNLLNAAFLRLSTVRFRISTCSTFVNSVDVEVEVSFNILSIPTETSLAFPFGLHIHDHAGPVYVLGHDQGYHLIGDPIPLDQSLQVQGLCDSTSGIARRNHAADVQSRWSLLLPHGLCCTRLLDVWEPEIRKLTLSTSCLATSLPTVE